MREDFRRESKKHKTEWAADLVSTETALQQVGRLVILQVADTGVSFSAQQQAQDFLLVGVTVKTRCHV